MYSTGCLWEQNVNNEKLHGIKVANVKRRLAQEKIDMVIVFRPENSIYISGLRPMWGEYVGSLSKYCSILHREGEPILLVRGIDFGRCKSSMTWIQEGNLRMMPDMGNSASVKEDVFKNFEPIFRKFDCFEGRIAIDASDFAIFDAFRVNFPKVEIVDGDFFMKQAKLIKEPEEIDQIKSACAITDVGFAIARKNMRHGIRECELAGKIFKVQYSLGAERPQGTHIVASGFRNVPLHRMATDRMMCEGDLLFLDLGVCYNGYYSDGSRVYALGKPRPEQKHLHKAIYESLQKMIKMCIPGAIGGDIAAAGRKVITDWGYGEYIFFGLFGHGVGTSAQEAPVIGEIATSGEIRQPLQPNMIIALEPGAFVPSIGGIRCEDVILITEHGPEVLTKEPYDEKLLD